MIPYNKNLTSNARDLRKNMTKEEKHLWYDFLKRLPISVKRQHNIENYIVDFYVPEKKVVIEIDGEQHFTEEGKISDKIRDDVLMSWGIKVIRYSNRDINKNFNAVVQNLLMQLGLSYGDME